MTFMMSKKTVEDNIYLKYGLEVQHLREAISRHDLLDVPEIKQMRDGTEKLKKYTQEKEQEKFNLSEATIQQMA